MSANRKVVFSPSLESGQRDWPDVDSFCEQLWLPYQQHGNASRERKSNYRIPSDQLRHLRELVSAWPLLAQTFGEILQLRVVIDANVAFEPLIWRLRRRRDLGARTGLHEAIDSGVVIAFAPQALQQEVLQHISEFAEDAKVPL